MKFQVPIDLVASVMKSLEMSRSAIVRRACWLSIAVPATLGSVALADTTIESTRGYSGSGALGYSGSGALGYSGSGALGYSGSGALTHNSTCAGTFGGGFAIAAMGPVESVVVAGDSVTLQILGLSFELDAGESFAIGDYVIAARDDSRFGTVVYHVGTAYVPGASVVKIKNVVSSVDPVLGTVSLGPTVDYTPLLSANPATAPEVDQTLEVSGVQPLAKGVVIARPDESGAVRCDKSDGRM